MTTSQLEKPFDLLCVEETEMLKNNLINIVQTSKLPLSVTKLVVRETFRELISAIDQTLTKTSQEYYTRISETTQPNDTVQQSESVQQTDAAQATNATPQTVSVPPYEAPNVPQYPTDSDE